MEEVLASQEIVLKDFQNKEKILIKKNNLFEQENIEVKTLFIFFISYFYFFILFFYLFLF